jgi:hypothetical protein
MNNFNQENEYKIIEDDYDPEMKSIMYELLDTEIEEVYAAIFALDTVEKQNRALKSWYEYLSRTCNAANPCIECLREGA